MEEAEVGDDGGLVLERVGQRGNGGRVGGARGDLQQRAHERVELGGVEAPVAVRVVELYGGTIPTASTALQ